MGKVKKNKRVNSDSVLAKKSNSGKTAKSNPFEVHLNKERFTILGRKINHGKGQPGVSRGKAFQKRKETLGQEYKELHKRNKFKDNRIERGIFTEDASSARFAAEKMRQFRETKKDLYNLNDDEILTHRGQTLEEIEQFNKEGSDDSENEDVLDAEFTEAAHFGGDGAEKSRTEAIQDMIAETKRRKIESAKQKEEVLDLTEKVDEKYKSVLPLIGKLNKRENLPRPKVDDYTRLMKELIFEPRGEVTDKLKSHEEIAKEEKERLEKLERERLARMNHPTDDNKPQHRSADALDDGFYIEYGDNEKILAYDKDGKSLYHTDETSQRVPQETAEGENDYSQANGEQESNADDSEETESEDEEDDLSDLKDDSTSGEEDIAENQKKKQTEKSVKKKQISKQFDDDLPHVFDMPKSYEDFYELIAEQSLENKYLIVDRIIKCNHPKLEAANRSKMINLFVFLLQYVNDIFDELDSSNIAQSFEIFGKLSPFLFDLAHFNPEKSSLGVLEVIKEKYGDFKERTKCFPSVNTLIFFKLVSNLFSTSDFRHPVVTPTFVFMSHILSRSRVKDRKDIAAGLFITTTVLEYTALSKRFLPAALNFLLGILFLAIPKRSVEILKIVPPFSATGPLSSLLVMEENLSQYDCEQHLQAKDLVIETIDNDFKIRALDVTLKLVNDALSTLQDVVGACYLAEPYVKYLEKLNLNNYPETVKNNYDTLQKTLEEIASKPLPNLVPPEKKPKMLRLYDPLIKNETNEKKRPKLSKKKEMLAIMQHKIKRETKGAIREIRRDNAFLSKLKLKKIIQSDMERKAKVQRIYAEAAMQQGELNALDRKKKKL